MSEPNPPGGVPPDVSPEYAEAYRRAYERALRGEAEGEPGEDTEQTEGLGEHYEHLFATEPERRPYDGPTHREDGERPRGERPAWLVPALMAGLVAILLLGAYLSGLVLSNTVEDADVSTDEPSGVVISEGGSTSTEPTPSKSQSNKPEQDVYGGRTQAATIAGATASCESAPSVDAAGNQIGYAPANSHDGDLSTAWRCDGDGVGQTLTLALPAGTEIGEVGLVPGYAKTDPRSGADRYSENNRITRVRWTFSDGSSLVQRLDGSATNRDLQTVRIPLTQADEVTIEVLESTPARRNTIAISEVRLGEAAGATP